MTDPPLKNDVINKDIEMKIISILFTVNATSIVKTLDIVVFNTYKAKIKKQINKNII